ncbi:oligosaccharide flippase family protein [Modestobacter sp. NPDC049651]|uniref:lipopolysaccharide biosynthesis protein n=1 Tax=unclassified Modestobacter TaxID=2643866 RepID=UPI0033C412B3
MGKHAGPAVLADGRAAPVPPPAGNAAAGRGGRHAAPAGPPSRSVGRVLLASGAARLLVLPVTGLASLVVSAVVTRAVGVEQFGAVMLVATLSQLLLFADLGAGAAVATAVARVEEPDGAEVFRRTLLTAVRTMLLSAGTIAVVAVAVGALGWWPSLLGISADPGGGLSADVATVLSLLAFSASLPCLLGEAVLRGSGRLHQAVLLAGLAGPVSLLVTLVLYWADAPVFAYAVTLPLGGLVGWGACALVAGRSVRPLLAGLPGQVLHRRRFPGRRIASTAVPWFIVMVGLPIALQTDRIVLAHRADARALSDYSYVTQLYSPLWSVVSMAALALWPVFAGRPGPGGLRRSWLRSVAVLSAMGVTFAVALLVLAGPVIDQVSDDRATVGWALLGCFAALLVVQSVHVGTGILLIAPAQLRFQAGCVVALVVTNLPLSWALAPSMGAAGPVVASIATVLCCQLVPGVLAGRRATGRAAGEVG